MKINSGTIVKSIICTFILCYIGYGLHRCHEEGSVIQVEFEEFNPPIYDFPFNVDTVVNALRSIDSSGRFYAKEINENFFKFQPKLDYRRYSCIYIYRKRKDRRVLEYFDLLVRWDSLGKDTTRVMVEKYNNEVYYGVKMWKDFQFLYFWHKAHPVDNPSIQEYEFLRLLGKQLGCLKNMPFTKYPKCFSQKDIMMIWGRYIPFTVEELFEYPEEGLEEWYQKNRHRFI